MLTHLGVNALFLQPRMGGIETYVRELFPALIELRPELRISMFVNDSGRELLATEPWAGDVRLVTHPLLGLRGLRAVSEAVLVDAAARRRGCNLLHSVAMTAPLRPSLPSVVMVPDVIWLRVPGAVPRATRALWKTLAIPAARRADRLITLSSSSRREISEDFRIPTERIDVVPLGPGRDAELEPTSERELRERLGLADGPIVLAVSALSAHKNLLPLIEAMGKVAERTPGAVLVVPANSTPLQAELEQLASSSGASVVFPGWVSPADLEGLYRAAACFAFPSLREGFGLPVLEAMRRGVPVVCSNVSAVPEVAGDAALLVDAHRPEELAAAISRVLEDRELAAQLGERGKARARMFSWKRAAEETLASYERALG
jgi:glycosyltransferase involved in cell wall biosynthesis